MRKVLLGVEFAVLYIGLPLLLVLSSARVPKLPVLILAADYCALILMRDPAFNRALLWNPQGARRALPGVGRLFLLAAPLLAAGVLLFQPAAFLSFVRRAPAFWGLVMLLYPVLSVYPQELIFRAFLFHRYRELLPTPGARIAASALAFSFVHILYGSALSLLLTLVGGFLFARTYSRSGSLLASSLEHALYGDLIFTVGLGSYFYRPPM